MRLLAVHADALSCEPVHSRGDVEPEEYPDPVSADGCIGAFVGVETGDGGRLGPVATAAAAELRGASDQLNTDTVVLVPTPHLVDDPAGRGVVTDVLDGIRVGLSDRDVRSVPAGWHLECELRTKGHPHAVRSRRLTGEDHVDEAAGETRWFLAGDTSADGRETDDLLVPIENATAVPAVLDGIVRGERRPARLDEILIAHGITTSDEGATGGGLRWTPRGLTMRACIRALLDERFVDATPVRTPVRLDPATAAIRKHVAAAGWAVEGASVTRRALCPGHLSAFADADLDADALPAALWEVGECERPDSVPQKVTLPEAHTATTDLDAALTVVEERLALLDDLDSTLGIDRVPVVRVTDEFYAAHEQWIEGVVGRFEGPVAVERGAVEHPFSVTFFASVGDDIVELGWLRVDVDGPERFGVEYADGTRRSTPVIVHTAPVGSIEALAATVLDRGVPTWIAPTQVRLLPIDQGQIERCRSVAATLSGAGVRVDIDDRARAVGERIAAVVDRVPYYVVVSDRGDEDTVRVTDSDTGRTEEATIEALADRIGASVPLDRPVSRRGPLCLSDRLVVGRSE
ncbi:threonyl-tRNA synthetase editing domain-containing protein [Natranaeroarchaeum sulfidigenes]|uniref:Threonyl-tRNA synthetase n=1 Tax=Natranaeroarchaeum sulfidigenes TaxID=2784880 RepID=A0A897MPU5_9EURY|nr:threonyl-tRNA synthetase editing domain-containing protein [Natranaeroarchaeum sulfidigenes]QSG04180.1 Threonyl-tRNA synthetase [Natranaeroarchaeum sulfidigenes]